MAATQYHLYTRYVNSKTGIAITNRTIENYVPLREFYSDDHQLFSEEATEEERRDAYSEKESYLLESMSVNNPKHDMLFYYTGTKRIYHKKFVPARQGYVINSSKLDKIQKNLITYNGDYTGDYVDVDGDIVAKKSPLIQEYKENQDYNDKICNAISDKNHQGILKSGGDSWSSMRVLDTDKRFNIVERHPSNAANGKYFTKGEAYDICKDNTIAQLKPLSELALSEMCCFNYYSVPVPGGINNKEVASDLHCCIVDEDNGGVDITNQIQPIVVGPFDTQGRTWKVSNGMDYNTYSEYLYEQKNALTIGITVTDDMIVKKVIPAHMEPVNDSTVYPYLVMDTYDRAIGDPWFLFEVFDSLNSAMDRTREVVKKLGIKNVKLVKSVPIDQYVKIV